MPAATLAREATRDMPQMGDLHTTQPDGLLPMAGGPRPPNSNTTRGNHQMKTNLLVPSMFIAFLFAFGISVHIDRRATPTDARVGQSTTTLHSQVGHLGAVALVQFPRAAHAQGRSCWGIRDDCTSACSRQYMACRDRCGVDDQNSMGPCWTACHNASDACVNRCPPCNISGAR